MLPSTGQTTHTHTHHTTHAQRFLHHCLMFKRKNNQNKVEETEKCQRYRNIYIEVCSAMQIQNGKIQCASKACYYSMY